MLNVDIVEAYKMACQKLGESIVEGAILSDELERRENEDQLKEEAMKAKEATLDPSNGKGEPQVDNELSKSAQD